MKKLIISMLLFFAIQTSQAQAHNMGTNYNCKLQKKGYFFNSEKHPCPACVAKDKKEQDAKIAEDKRRTDVAMAKAKAEREAKENARLEKLRIEQAEAKSIKDKEIADKIASDAMMKKYKEIAEKGMVKSNVKGATTTTDFNIDKIIPFSDKERKIYGFKIDGVEVLTFSFEYKNMYIDRIKGSNLFSVSVYKEVEHGWERYSHTFLIDYLGKKIEVDGTTNFDYKIIIEQQNNLIYLFKKISTEATGKIVSRSNGGLDNFHNSRESALADVQSFRKAGWSMTGDEIVCLDTRYTIDFNGNLLEKLNGYTIRIIDK
jgi:hypothetical protein